MTERDRGDLKTWIKIWVKREEARSKKMEDNEELEAKRKRMKEN